VSEIHPETPAVSAKGEPGRRAFEIWAAELDRLGLGTDTWHDQPGDDHAAWAVVESHFAAAAVDAPAELTAAMAETRAVRDGYATLCKEFGPSPQSGWSARISLTVLNRHRVAAGLDGLSRTPSNNREDLMMRYRRERDEARAELDTSRELHRLSRLSAAGDESELRHIHETLAIAYGREDLSEETATVVEAMAAERGRYRKALEEIDGMWDTTSDDSCETAADMAIIARQALGGDHA
jgi:hypothetical protein